VSAGCPVARKASLWLLLVSERRDAGASRVVVYSQRTRQEDAEGKGLEVVTRLAPGHVSDMELVASSWQSKFIAIDE
jgi:hypothetical protein